MINEVVLEIRWPTTSFFSCARFLIFLSLQLVLIFQITEISYYTYLKRIQWVENAKCHRPVSTVSFSLVQSFISFVGDTCGWKWDEKQRTRPSKQLKSDGSIHNSHFFRLIPFFYTKGASPGPKPIRHSICRKEGQQFIMWARVWGNLMSGDKFCPTNPWLTHSSFICSRMKEVLKVRLLTRSICDKCSHHWVFYTSVWFSFSLHCLFLEDLSFKFLYLHRGTHLELLNY